MWATRFSRASTVRMTSYCWARAGWAGNDVDAAVAQPERLQHLVADAHFFLGFGRQRDPDRVADARPQERTQPDRGLHRAGAQAARLGDADMQGVIAGIGQLLIGGHGQEDVGRLHADLEVVEIVILQDARMVERAFDHRLGAGLAVFLQQVLLQRPGIDADAHGDAMVAGGLDHLAHPLGTADIARIDAQAGRAGIGGLERALIVEMDIGHDRHFRGLDDRVQRPGRVLVGAGHPDDVDPGLLAAPDLGDGGLGIGGQGCWSSSCTVIGASHPPERAQP